MSEIEKMYENVKLTNLYCGDDYIAEYMLQSECTNDNEEKCKTCDKVKISYPPFTAEKQIELIKWLALRDGITIVAYIGGIYSSEHDKYNVSECSLESCLARLINNLWQGLTEKEKQQIKDILK